MTMPLGSAGMGPQTALLPTPPSTTAQMQQSRMMPAWMAPAGIAPAWARLAGIAPAWTAPDQKSSARMAWRSRQAPMRRPMIAPATAPV
jgi:hypothetical protein